MPREQSLRQILGDNVRALRKHHRWSQPHVAAATKRGGAPIDQTTIGRIERAANPTTVDSLASLARGLGVEPWTLLVPDLKPGHPPELSENGLTPNERELIDKYRAASPRWQVALQHLAGLRSDQQDEVSEGTMVLLAKVAADPAKDEHVAAHYGKPGARKSAPPEPVLHDPAERKYRR